MSYAPARRVTLFACTRGQRTSSRCQTVGCSGVTVALCDYPLSGKRAGDTCSRRLCASCRHERGAGVDYCAAHAALAARHREG